MTDVLQLDIFGYWFSSLSVDIQQDITELVSLVINGEDLENAISVFEFENQNKPPKCLATVNTFVTSFFKHLKNNNRE